MHGSTDSNSNSGKSDDTSAKAANPPTLFDPSLGPAIGKDCEAMVDSMHKTDEVVAYLERQLIGQAHEIESLKKEVGETASRFRKIQDSIASLRQERHDLAYKAICALELKMELARVKAQLDQVVQERNRVLEVLAAQSGKPAAGRN